MTIALISVGCIFGGALLGMALSRFLPAEHLSADSRDAVKVGAGMVSLMSALVLGLLVSSAKSNFDATNDAITQGGAKAILLDRVLAHYGAETAEIRAHLRRGVAASIALLWPEERPTAPDFGAFVRTDTIAGLLDEIRALEPKSDAQRALQAQAQQLGNEIWLSRWIQIEQAQTSLPRAFLVILLFWLTTLYVSFGLLAPRNATVVGALLIGALSVATAVFLILEMYDPMGGLIRTSSGPLREALEQLGR